MVRCGQVSEETYTPTTFGVKNGRPVRRAMAVEQAAAVLERERGKRKDAGETGLAAVLKPVLPRLAEDDATLDEVEKWYLRGFTTARELAPLVNQTESRLRDTLLPALMYRLARGHTQQDRLTALTKAIMREQGLQQQAWMLYLEAGCKAATKVQLLYFLHQSNRRLAQLEGVSKQSKDGEMYFQALTSLLDELTELIQTTNNPHTISKYERMLERFINERELSKPPPIDADYTDVPGPATGMAVTS